MGGAVRHACRLGTGVRDGLMGVGKWCVAHGGLDCGGGGGGGDVSALGVGGGDGGGDALVDGIDGHDVWKEVDEDDGVSAARWACTISAWWTCEKACE